MIAPRGGTGWTTAVVLDRPGPGRAADLLAGGGVEVIGEAPPSVTAGRLVLELDPEVVVVDLDAGGPALTAIDAVVAAAPRVPVLVLAGDPDHSAVLAAVRAGAAGLVVRAAAAGLVDAVVRTARGEAVFSPGLADVVLAEFGRPADPHEGTGRLTEREADVLRLVVDGLTARQIATRLVLSPRTVENHVQNVLRKLRLHSRAALVRYAIENGLA